MKYSAHVTYMYMYMRTCTCTYVIIFQKKKDVGMACSKDSGHSFHTNTNFDTPCM